jgi:negative regulator of sigma E activity
MNEQEQVSQLSALFDGELPPQQAGMVIRRALRDPGMRTSWERYALIGACLRGDPVGGRISVADRVQAKLAAERDLNVAILPAKSGQSRVDSPRASLLGRGALGGAIAAGVAALSIFLVRAMLPVTAEPGALMAQGDSFAVGADASTAGLEAGGDVMPAGYTTPGANSPAQRRMLDASLSHYLVAHSEEAASALRSSYDELAGGTELTQDQISALR